MYFQLVPVCPTNEGHFCFTGKENNLKGLEISELTTPKIPIPEPMVVMVGMMSNLPA